MANTVHNDGQERGRGHHQLAKSSFTSLRMHLTPYLTDSLTEVAKTFDQIKAGSADSFFDAVVDLGGILYSSVPLGHTCDKWLECDVLRNADAQNISFSIIFQLAENRNLFLTIICDSDRKIKNGALFKDVKSFPEGFEVAFTLGEEF